jgi:hypothetical protein
MGTNIKALDIRYDVVTSYDAQGKPYQKYELPNVEVGFLSI